MTISNNAGIVYDLRHAWPLAPVVARPAGEGDSVPPESPPPPAGHTEVGEAEGDGSAGDNGHKDQDVRNPELKKLHDEAARYRNAAKAEKERADKADEALRTARIENAFLHAAIGKVNDTDVAWKLADCNSVQLDVDGTPIGLDEVVVNVVERYPYLRPEVSDDDVYYGGDVPPTQPSGRETNGRRRTEDHATRSALEARFPALRGRG